MLSPGSVSQIFKHLNCFACPCIKTCKYKRDQISNRQENDMTVFLIVSLGVFNDPQGQLTPQLVASSGGN